MRGARMAAGSEGRGQRAGMTAGLVSGVEERRSGGNNG